MTGRASHRHRLALLAILARAPNGSMGRSKLRGYLWPDSDPRRARHLLNVALHILRKELGENALVSEGDDLRLDRSTLWIDATEFDSAFDSGDHRDAAELYGGAFLDGFVLGGSPEFERWVDQERAALARRYGRVLEALAVEASQKGDRRLAVTWWRKLAAEDRFNSRVAAGLIEALIAAGDRGGALEHARLHEVFLHEEFGAEPDPRILALAEALRENGELGAAEASAAGSEENAQTQLTTADYAASEAQATAHPAVERPVHLPRVGGIRIPTWLGIAAGAAVLALVVATLALIQRSVPVSASLDPGRVVVAAFENQTGDESLDPLGRVAADWLSQRLAQSGLLQVVDPSIALLYSDEPTVVGGRERISRVQALAERTGAGLAVTGTFLQDGDSLVIQGQIVDAGRQELVFASGPVQAYGAAPLEGVERVADRLLGALAARVDERVGTTAGGPLRPPSYAAYIEYVEGLDLFVRRRYEDAIPYFQRAAAKDTGFVQPYFWMAFAYGQLAEWPKSDSVIRQIRASRQDLGPLDRHALDYFTARAEGHSPGEYDASRRAAELAPQSFWPFVHSLSALKLNRPRQALEALEGLDPERGWVRGWVGYWYMVTSLHHLLGQHEQELDAARRARAQNSSSQEFITYELRALIALGRLGEIEALLSEARSLPPPGPGYAEYHMMGELLRTTGLELRAHGHTEAASEIVDRTIDWYVSNPPEHEGDRHYRYRLGQLLYYADRLEEARAIYVELASERPSVDVSGTLGAIEASLGNREEARKLSAFLADPPDSLSRPIGAFLRAKIAALLGDRDEAIRLLQESYAKDGAPAWMQKWDVPLRKATMLHQQPGYEALRDEPEFLQLVRLGARSAG